MSCEHDCNTPPPFPADLWNRPRLSHFRYRIGDYASMREHMLDELVKAPMLSGWTHLGADEPGIALLESTALLGDILTFYQELYANETKLGTANWEESVLDLIRLTGYRPAPGLGGTTTFALDVESRSVVPAQFAFQADLEGFDQPSVFESTLPIEAFPAFGKFHLYRRRLGLQPIQGATSLDIARIGNQTDLLSRQDHGIEAGDRILLMSGPFAPHEILVVSSTDVHLDRVTLHLEGEVQNSHPATVTAYKIGRNFRHFGAELPREFSTFEDNPPKTSLHETTFTRSVTGKTNLGQYYSRLSELQMPLESEVDDLSAGIRMICVGQLVQPETRDFVFVRQVKKIIPGETLWGNVSSPTTILTLSGPLRNTGFFPFANVAQQITLEFSDGINSDQSINQLPGLSSEQVSRLSVGQISGQSFEQLPAFEGAFEVAENANAEVLDIRRLRLYETLGDAMLLRAPPKQVDSMSDGKVYYFGTHEEALALSGRRLLLMDDTENAQDIVVADEQPELIAAHELIDDMRMWPIQLGVVPSAGPGGFSELEPSVAVYGNLVDTTQGESQSEVAIGSGDGHQIFQTFALPKAPLTYLSDPIRSPPYSPELEIRVDGRLWQSVESFFELPATAEVYVVRQLEDDDYVQFGDGVNGAKLDSGRNNVTASYRVGFGARGELVEDSTPTTKDKLKSISSVSMPGSAVGGAEPETMLGARLAAPGKMQSLGRLVGLSDYESEALAIPGVLKAGAVFSPQIERPLIALTILTDDESVDAVTAVEAALRHADQCRGAARYSLQVIAGKRRYIALNLSLGYDPTYRKTDLDAAVTSALGALPALDAEAPKGELFSIDQRRFGQDVHISQVVARAQSVEGVLWVKPVSFLKLSTDSDGPAELSIPSNPDLNPRINAATTEVLALSALHLTLSATSVMTDEECPA